MKMTPILQSSLFASVVLASLIASGLFFLIGQEHFDAFVTFEMPLASYCFGTVLFLYGIITLLLNLREKRTAGSRSHEHYSQT